MFYAIAQDSYMRAILDEPSRRKYKKRGGWSAAPMHFYSISIFSVAFVRSVAKDF
jgi:hypothetical protein